MDVVIVAASHNEKIVITFNGIDIKIRVIKSLQMRKCFNDRVIVIVIACSGKIAKVGAWLIKIRGVVGAIKAF